MRVRDLERLFATLLAGASLAGCPVCETGEVETTVLRPPPANPGGTPPPAAPQDPSQEECDAACGVGWVGCEADEVVDEVSGEVTPVLVCTNRFDCGGVGRRPAGLRRVATPARGVGPDAAWLARAAHLEAASVVAFERLAAELAALGAPPSLVARARRAAADEARHARVVGRLALRRGARVPAARVRPARARSVFAMAIENALVGCVEETFGALVAHHQATHAAEADLRRSMRRIARDETRHAALSWDVAGFLAGHLSPGERARVARAAARASARLTARWEVDPAIAEPLGLPDAARGRALAAGLGAALLRGSFEPAPWSFRSSPAARSASASRSA